MRHQLGVVAVTGHERERRDERQQSHGSVTGLPEHVDHPKRDREQSAQREAAAIVRR